MKNEEKFKTADERVKAFDEWCRKEEKCKKCGLGTSRACAYCFNRWLVLEAEEQKIEPCPFCGEKCELHEIWDNEMCRSAGRDVRCTMCEYRSPEASQYDGSDAIAAHNRVARAVRAAEKGEVK